MLILKNTLPKCRKQFLPSSGEFLTLAQTGQELDSKRVSSIANEHVNYSEYRGVTNSRGIVILN
uniref:Uncharacterized protein n=1 Tax=Arundo donax TaxID=35708 RepID=A0A0A9I336_ARUDO